MEIIGYFSDKSSYIANSYYLVTRFGFYDLNPKSYAFFYGLKNYEAAQSIAMLSLPV